MNRNKVCFIIVFSAITLFIAAILFFIFQDLSEEGKLRKEIEQVSKLDPIEDEIPMRIVTKGDYGKVEKVIKEYLNDYSIELKATLALIEDPILPTLLSIENYQKDGPDFVTSKTYLNDLKQKVNEHFIKLTQLSEKKTIKERIKGEKLGDYYVELYEELMYEDMEEEEFKELKKELEKSKKDFFDLLTKEEKVLDFLTANKGNWSIKEKQLEFYSQEKVEEYNKMIES